MRAAEAAVGARRVAWGGYVELTKPRLTLFVLVVVLISAWLASGDRVDLFVLLSAVMGTGLVAAGASALNMLLERGPDARMKRTRNRPLPSGRLAPRDVAAFGLVVSAAGTIQLAWATTGLAALLALVSLAAYVLLYTPLKRMTTLNTHIGAIPGAMPALIGWAAVAGELAPVAWMLFLLVYLWQIPHFLSIAWIYRKDYERGGFLMLPVVDPAGRVTGRQAALGALALIPVSLLPGLGGVAGPLYLSGALLAGLYFFWRALDFALNRSERKARRLMRASLLYLPLVLAIMLVNRIV